MTRWTESDLATLKSKSRVIVHLNEPRSNMGTKLPFCTEEANACVGPDCAPGNGCIYDGLMGTNPEKGGNHVSGEYSRSSSGKLSGSHAVTGVASVKTRTAKQIYKKSWLKHPQTAPRTQQERRQSISKPRKNSAKAFSEAKALQAIREYLQYHHKVAWVERMNTGALRVEGRFIRFGVPGLSDLIGMLKSGQFLAIEVKSSRGLLTPAQERFLKRVRHLGGVSGVARTIEDVEKILGF